MKDKFEKTFCKSEINITCRGCKKFHQLIDKYPVNLTCKCGYVIAKDGIIWPSGENK